MPGQGREASTDRKESVDQDVLMITEQLRAKANPLTPTASRKSRDLLKELTKSKKKKKKVPSGLPHRPKQDPIPWKLLVPSLQTQCTPTMGRK